MKKTQQLGMNPSTASGRLVKDLLWKYIVKCGDNKCHQCGEEMVRDNFSIEHKIPWLDSDDPQKFFFDIENISFSHHSCNIKAARRDRPSKTEEEKKQTKQENNRRNYTPEKRRDRYLRTGR